MNQHKDEIELQKHKDYIEKMAARDAGFIKTFAKVNGYYATVIDHLLTAAETDFRTNFANEQYRYALDREACALMYAQAIKTELSELANNEIREVDLSTV